MKAKIVVLAAAVFLFWGISFARAQEWLTVNVPGASYTYPMDVDGNIVVGYYRIAAGSNNLAFLYDMKSSDWTYFSVPGSIDTSFYGISGNYVVGRHRGADSKAHGLIYDLVKSDWTTLDNPDWTSTQLRGIDGNNIIGIKGASDEIALYNLADETFTDLGGIIPGATGIYPRGISGTIIVGDYRDGVFAQYPFIYDLSNSSFETFVVEGEDVHGIDPSNIDGKDVVGRLSSGRSFIYDIDSKGVTLIAKPGAGKTEAFGIEGDVIIGSFSSSPAQGFIYIIPEPSTLVLFIAGSIMFVAYLWLTYSNAKRWQINRKAA